MPNTVTSTFISAPDGLKLHARCWGPRAARGLPVICLPGLARTTADFDALAPTLANGGERRVIAIDYRGRGLSDYDRDPANYNFAVELADVLAVATALECLPAVFVGTSRGGILTMLLAPQRPTAIAGAVLNDVGPVLEAKGLIRIKGYVGKLPQPRSYEDGAEILRRLFSAQFPKLTPDDWLKASQRSFKHEKGGLAPTYDVTLAKTMQGWDLEKPLPPLWKEFDAMHNMRVMVVRGANSDLLSTATVEAMAARHPGLETFEVPDQGHAPFLAEPDTIARIAEFVRGCSGTFGNRWTEAGATEQNSSPVAGNSRGRLL
jgi:pimeloyl-ACP methyl ester carboxylesterase